MRSDIAHLRQVIQQAEDKLRQDRATLARVERECSHVWDNPNGVYKPIHHEAYTIPGDPPGTMGVDWRGPCHVPAKTEEKWVRTCTICGKVEETGRAVQKTVTVGGDFGGGRRF